MKVETIEGYLLDSCIISLLFNEKDPQHAAVKARLAAIAAKGGPVLLPVMAVAEIRFGMELAGAASAKQLADLEAFFEKYPSHPFDDGAVESYALIRARLLRTYGSKKTRGFKEKHLHQLCDPATRASLEIFERDLMIVSVAIEHNLILATRDQAHGMQAICAAAALLEAEGKPTRLRVEYWP